MKSLSIMGHSQENSGVFNSEQIFSESFLEEGPKEMFCELHTFCLHWPQTHMLLRAFASTLSAEKQGKPRAFGGLCSSHM